MSLAAKTYFSIFPELLRYAHKTVFRVSFSNSERFRNFSQFAGTCLRVLVLFPADRIHGIPSFTRRHDDTQIVTSSRQIVIRLVSQGNLIHQIRFNICCCFHGLTTTARTISPGLKLSNILTLSFSVALTS